jgi:hypothetical protein
LFLLSVTAARGGLYNDEKKITSGDVKDLDYWHAKFYQLMLEEAIKTHQPEYKVGYLAEAQIEKSLPPLIKKYPNDRDLQKWMQRCEEIVKLVDPDADQTSNWKPDFAYWDYECYRQAWVNMNLGRMGMEAGDWPDAASRFGWADQNLAILLNHQEWMKNWPKAVVKWVKATKETADKLTSDMRKRSEHDPGASRSAIHAGLPALAGSSGARC